MIEGALSKIQMQGVKIKMKRILIIGCCGAGKSTLAHKLSSILDLPKISLDQYFWKPNWQPTEIPEWEKIVSKLCKKKEWIIDGNFKDTLEERLKRSDTVIFLNFNEYFCILRTLKRVFLDKKRIDKIKGCEEHLDIHFLKYIKDFNKTVTTKIFSTLDKNRHQSIFVLKKPRELRQFLKDIQKGNNLNKYK